MRKVLPGAAFVAVAVVGIAWLVLRGGGDASPRAPDSPRPGRHEGSPTLAPARAGSPGPAGPAEERTAGRPEVPEDRGARARLVVQVVDAEERPVPRATVRVRVGHGPSRGPAAVLVTDEAGRCEPDVSSLWALAEVRLSVASVDLAVSAPGYQPSQVSVPAATLAVGGVDERKVSLWLRPGGVVRGRLIAASGPVVEGDVRLEGPGDRDAAAWARPDEEGRFEVGIGGPGPHRLVVTAANAGAAVRSIDLDPSRDFDAGDIALVGSGSIEGIARYPDETPVPGLVVRAFSPSAVIGGSIQADPGPSPAGLVSTVATTDPGGRFRLAGLRPGRYVVARQLSKATPENVHPTGARDVVLVVQDARIRFRVVDEDGASLPGTTFVARTLDDDGFRSAGNVSDSGGVVDVWTSPGVRIGFAARAGEALPTEVEGVVPPGSFELEVPVVLRAGRPQTGRLVVRLRGPDGAPVRAAVVSVRTPVADAIVRQAALVSETGEFEVEGLAEGRYRVEVVPDKRKEWGPPLHLHHPIERDLSVRAGADTRLDLETRLGGRVRLTIRTADGGALAEKVAMLLTVSATPSSGSPIPLGALYAVTDDGWTSILRAGVAAVGYQLLEPGRYTLRVTAPDMVDAEAVVDVVAGAIVDVEIVLRPK